MTRTLMSLVAGLALALGGLAGPADADAGWTPVRTLATGAAGSGTMDLEVNARGDGVLAYTPDGTTLWVSLRRSGRPWSAPRMLSTGPQAYEPQVGITADGRSMVVWTQTAPSGTWLRATTFTAAGGRGATRDVTSPAGYANRPSLGVNPSGRVALAWVGLAGVQRAHGTTGVLDSPLPPGVPLDNGSGTSTYSPNAAVDHAGNVVFAWENDYPDRWRVEARVQPVGGVLQPMVTLAGDVPNNRAQNPSLSITPQGEATLVFAFRSDSGAPAELRYMVRPVGGGGFASAAWSPSGLASLPGQEVGTYGAGVTATGAGSSVVSYVASGARWVASRAGGGYFRHQLVSGPGEVAPIQPQPGLSSRGGTTTVSWVSQTGDSWDVRTVVRRGASTFGATRTVASRGGAAGAVASGIDDEGNAYLGVQQQSCWPGCTGGTSAVRLLEYDAADPAVARVSKPKKPKVGKKAKFSVAASDRVSAIKIVWRFGDGKKATGATVKHKYAKAGKKKVKVTVTDALGNVTVRKLKVKVRPAD